MGEGLEQEKLYVKKGWSNFLKGPDIKKLRHGAHMVSTTTTQLYYVAGTQWQQIWCSNKALHTNSADDSLSIPLDHRFKISTLHEIPKQKQKLKKWF